MTRSPKEKMTSLKLPEADSFWDKVSVGQEIPPLTRKAELKELFLTWGHRGGELHPVFGGTHLDSSQAAAATEAEKRGVDPIHLAPVFPGNQALEFLSQMITNWLPWPRAWLFGGKLEVRLIEIISPNETITCRGRVIEKIAKGKERRLVCEVWVEKENGSQAVVGQATLQF